MGVSANSARLFSLLSGFSTSSSTLLTTSFLLSLPEAFQFSAALILVPGPGLGPHYTTVTVSKAGAAPLGWVCVLLRPTQRLPKFFRAKRVSDLGISLDSVQ